MSQIFTYGKQILMLAAGIMVVMAIAELLGVQSYVVNPVKTFKDKTAAG